MGISGISFKSSLKVLEGVGNKRGGGGLTGGVSGGGVVPVSTGKEGGASIGGWNLKNYPKGILAEVR